MAEFPKCPNFTKKRGCDRSDIKLIGENEEAWTFRCGTCTLVWVVSKSNSIHRGKLRAHEEKLRKEAEARRARDKRTKIFA
jgi:hypothetical protein